MIPAFFCTILIAIAAVTGRRLSRLMGGTEANFWRLCFAALVLAAYAHLVGVGFQTTALLAFVISGAIGFGLGDVCLFQALPRIGSRLSTMMVLCLSAPLAAFMEWVWLKNALSAAEMICAAVILGGVALALAPRDNPQIPQRKLYPGMVFGFLAALCQGLGAVLSRKGFDLAAAAGESIDGVTSAYQRILGGVMATGICLLVVKRREICRAMEPGVNAPSPVRRRRWRLAWPWLIVNGLSGPALGISCYQWALKTTPTGIVLPIVALTPLVVIPFARFMEGERPTRRSLVGGAIAVLGAVLLSLTHLLGP